MSEWFEVTEDGVKGSADGGVVKTFNKGDAVYGDLGASFMKRGLAKEGEGEAPVVEAENLVVTAKLDDNSKEELEEIRQKVENFVAVSQNCIKLLSVAGIHGKTINAIMDDRLPPAKIEELVSDLNGFKDGRKACTSLLKAFGLSEENVSEIVNGTFDPADLTAQISDIEKKREEAARLKENSEAGGESVNNTNNNQDKT